MPEKQAVVIVTGSSGFVGEAVCSAFLNDGYSVVGFDRPDAVQPRPGVRTVECGVTAEDSVAQAVNAVRRDFSRADRVRHSPGCVLDNSRARALLGWSPRRSLRQALPRMITALEPDPEGFYRLNKVEGEPPQHETATTARRAETKGRT